MAEFSPLEDVALAVLRERIPALRFTTIYEQVTEFPYVMIRRDPSFGGWTGDPRFIDSGRITCHVLVSGPDNDQDAADLGDAIRVALRDAANERKTYATGTVLKAKQHSNPARRSDWASATGPVQYADLPAGVVRYECSFDIAVRKPRTTPAP
jgi:hypothetical protein